jgi:Rps23 Pro-64 3,4-dihydroxylase Tpa1-like proline 4-hydroxylase
MSAAHAYSIEPSAQSVAAAYRRRAHIPQFLRAADADAIHQALATLSRWNTVTRSGDRHLDLDAAGLRQLRPEDQIRFENAVHDGARRGFQYLFDNYPVADAYYAGTIVSDKLARFFEFLNSPETIAFAREVTGIPDIKFADAQATRYRPGHFLTEHDDAVDGKNRCAAFVLNLTHNWRADWGGLLMFIGEDGHVEEAYTPRFNALNIFTVPQRHSVSVVAPFAATERFSITGWFRSGEDPLKKTRRKS